MSETEKIHVRQSATEYHTDLSLDWVTRWEHLTGIRPSILPRLRSRKNNHSTGETTNDYT
jgi:hypothetical protein